MPRASPVLYIPYQLYAVGSRVVGCDSHFWLQVKENILRILLVKPPTRLTRGPGRDGLVLKPRIPLGGHANWLEWASRLEARPMPVRLEELAYAHIGLEASGQGDALDEALKGLARILLTRGRVRPLGAYSWFRLQMPGCEPGDPAYSILSRRDPELGLALKEACVRALG